MKNVNRIVIMTFLFSCIFMGFVSASSSAGTSSGQTHSPSNFPVRDALLNDLLDFGPSNETSSNLSDFLTNNSTDASGYLNNSTPSIPTGDLSGYASVGDIINANDWVALDRYTKSVGAESDIPDSEASIINRNSPWA